MILLDAVGGFNVDFKDDTIVLTLQKDNNILNNILAE